MTNPVEDAPIAATRYCLTCGYALDGLPEHRCPECGRGYDGSVLTTSSPSLARVRHFAAARRVATLLTSPVGVAAGIWLTLVCPPFMFLTIPLWLMAVARSATRRRWFRSAALGAAFVVPLAGFFVLGLVDYGRGDAALRSTGLSLADACSVDPTWRCERRVHRHFVTGFERLTHPCYNAGVKTMIRLFGPMPGSYLGPLPTRTEALAALAGAQTIAPGDLARDRVPVHGGLVMLDTHVGIDITSRMSWWRAPRDSDCGWSYQEIGPISAVMCRGMLVIRVFSDEPAGNPARAARIALIDTETGRPVAYYDEGDYSGVFRPAMWRK